MSASAYIVAVYIYDFTASSVVMIVNGVLYPNQGSWVLQPMAGTQIPANGNAEYSASNTDLVNGVAGYILARIGEGNNILQINFLIDNTQNGASIAPLNVAASVGAAAISLTDRAEVRQLANKMFVQFAQEASAAPSDCTVGPYKCQLQQYSSTSALTASVFISDGGQSKAQYNKLVSDALASQSKTAAPSDSTRGR